jgi:hypothetical protein
MPTGAGDYWRSGSDLEAYNSTFGERIGWKWDTVLAGLARRGWNPPGGVACDWGCGSGIVGRRVLAAWPGIPLSLVVWDRSPLAREFALRTARRDFPHVGVQARENPERIDLLLVSHVLNELSPRDLDSLLAVARRATAVIWVEPGTYETSRALIEVREMLRAQFTVVAPCTHQERCGILTDANRRHWCHHFAMVPSHVFMDAGWREFANVLEIDLRSLPYSFLVLDSRRCGDACPDLSRVIGKPRHYKGYSKILSCQRSALEELTLQHRDAPALAKELRKKPGAVYAWQRDGERILSGSRVT